MMKNKKKYFECSCHSKDHVVSFDSDNDFTYIHTQLNNYLPWYKRIYVAFKYIFKPVNADFHWDCCMLSYEEGQDVKWFLEVALNEQAKKLYEQKRADEALPGADK